MKLNNQIAYNLKVRVNDYIVNQDYGFCILADYMSPSNYLDMDVHEFQHLYDAVCNMKELIENEREKCRCPLTRSDGTKEKLEMK